MNNPIICNGKMWNGTKKRPSYEGLRNRGVDDEKSVRPGRTAPVPLFQTACWRNRKRGPPHLSSGSRIVKVIDESATRAISTGISTGQSGGIKRGIAGLRCKRQLADVERRRSTRTRWRRYARRSRSSMKLAEWTRCGRNQSN